jgi:hypothetical protein
MTLQRRMRNLPEEIQEALRIALPLGVAETEAVARKYAPTQEQLAVRREARLARERFERLPPEVQKGVKRSLVLGRAELQRRHLARTQEEHDAARREAEERDLRRRIEDLVRRIEEENATRNHVRSRSPHHHRRH